MSDQPVNFPGKAGVVRIERGPAGVPQISAASLNDAFEGLGYCHARDRGLQMLLLRILGRGTGSEELTASGEMLALDRFFRSWNFGGDAAVEEQALSGRARAAVTAYCQGVNHYFGGHRIPWELRLMGVRFEPWTIADIFLVAKLAGFIGLSQSQAEMEQFVVECARNGVPRAQLEELFPGQINGLDEDLLRCVKLPERLVPAELKWAAAAPRHMASNNWAVAGVKTASGKAIFCNDPHLAINCLPNVWYEVVLRWSHGLEHEYAIGATIPGAPGLIIGRTHHLAWGVTYAFADCVDSWIEDCRDGRYRRGDDWHAFRVRQETIYRKHKAPVAERFYENDHGVLNGDPNQPGLYLATRWSAAEHTGATAMDAVCGILDAKTVDDGRCVLSRLSNAAWNWVLADLDGSIGYQMSGRIPRRPAGVSGLVPLPGWDAANDWQGFEPPEHLPRALNPPEGFIATANDDLNHLGKAHPINLPQTGYRAERIRDVLAGADKITVAQMARLQVDLDSRQARRFLPIILPLLDEFAAQHAEPVRLLRTWDFSYGSDSPAAFLFEQIYQALLDEVFGGGTVSGPGPAVLKRLREETCLFCDFIENFDRVLVAETSAWFGGRARAEVYRAALKRALGVPLEPYGQRRRLRMQHLLFGHKLPLFLGFDRMLELPGGRATVWQGQIYRHAGRETSFGPAYRIITDFATDEAHTALVGGASDRRLSPWYADGIAGWLTGDYKVLKGRVGPAG